jgi:hypothetical protein
MVAANASFFFSPAVTLIIVRLGVGFPPFATKAATTIFDSVAPTLLRIGWR